MSTPCEKCDAPLPDDSGDVVICPSCGLSHEPDPCKGCGQRALHTLTCSACYEGLPRECGPACPRHTEDAAPTYQVERHAAHDLFTGAPLHDLETWTVLGDFGARPGDALGAEYHHGFLGRDGKMYSVFTRRAPASQGRCERCPRQG